MKKQDLASNDMNYKTFSQIELVNEFYNDKKARKGKLFEYISGIQGTLFENDTELLNLNKLDDFLSKEKLMAGINSPFLYVGETVSAFAMHVYMI